MAGKIGQRSAQPQAMFLDEAQNLWEQYVGLGEYTLSQLVNIAESMPIFASFAKWHLARTQEPRMLLSLYRRYAWVELLAGIIPREDFTTIYTKEQCVMLIGLMLDQNMHDSNDGLFFYLQAIEHYFSYDLSQDEMNFGFLMLEACAHVFKAEFVASVTPNDEEDAQSGYYMPDISTMVYTDDDGDTPMLLQIRRVGELTHQAVKKLLDRDRTTPLDVTKVCSVLTLQIWNYEGGMSDVARLVSWLDGQKLTQEECWRVATTKLQLVAMDAVEDTEQSLCVVVEHVGYLLHKNTTVIRNNLPTDDLLAIRTFLESFAHSVEVDKDILSNLRKAIQTNSNYSLLVKMATFGSNPLFR